MPFYIAETLRAGFASNSGRHDGQASPEIQNGGCQLAGTTV
jgi:hypothetical protein